MEAQRAARADDCQRVLLAAHDGARATRLEKAIRHDTDWTVDRVKTGDAALRAVAESSFSLVLLDAQLAVVSATEITRILRGRAASASVPIVVVSFNQTNSDGEAQAFSAGADDHVDGTCPLPALVGRLRRVVMRRQSPRMAPATPASTPSS